MSELSAVFRSAADIINRRGWDGGSYGGGGGAGGGTVCIWLAIEAAAKSDRHRHIPMPTIVAVTKKHFKVEMLRDIFNLNDTIGSAVWAKGHLLDIATEVE